MQQVTHPTASADTEGHNPWEARVPSLVRSGSTASPPRQARACPTSDTPCSYCIPSSAYRSVTPSIPLMARSGGHTDTGLPCWLLQAGVSGSKVLYVSSPLVRTYTWCCRGTGTANLPPYNAAERIVMLQARWCIATPKSKGGDEEVLPCPEHVESKCRGVPCLNGSVSTLTFLTDGSGAFGRRCRWGGGGGGADLLVQEDGGLRVGRVGLHRWP